MIESASIKNFKALKEVEIRNLRRVNLISGANNVGKTTILEAMFMFFDRMNPTFITRQFTWRGMDSVSPNPESFWAPLFHGYKMKESDISIAVKQNGTTETMRVHYAPNYTKRITFNPQNMNENVGSTSALEIFISKNNSNTSQRNILTFVPPQTINFEIENPINQSHNAIFLTTSNHLTEDLARFFGILDELNNAEQVIEYLKIIEPRLTTLTTIASPSGRPILYGDIGIDRKIPINFMGEGTSRILQIILTVVANPKSVVFIDEIENGIHYSVLPKLWHMIGVLAQKFDCQIFATTHSYECLQSAIIGLTKEAHNDFTYVRLDRIIKDENIRLIATDSSYETLKTSLENGWEVR